MKAVTGTKMDFQVRRSDLLAELALIQNVVERKSNIPILSNVLIRADQSGLYVAGTDLEIGISSCCPSETQAGGSVTLPAKRLLEIVRNLPEGDLTVKQGDGCWVTVACGKSRFRLAGLPDEDFPTLAQPKGDPVKIPVSIMVPLITQTIFAISMEDSKYTLSGALLTLTPNSITMVATDGHRLAMAQKSENVSAEVKALIPKKALTEIVRIVGESQGVESVEFSVGDNHLFFKIGHRLLIARTTAGQFPNYEAVIPRTNGRILTVKRDSLISAIRRVAILADEHSRTIKWEMSRGALRIMARAEAGESSEDVDIEYGNDSMETGFNWGYLLDFLNATDVDEVRCEFKDTESAALFRAGDDFQYVVMPMRT